MNDGLTKMYLCNKCAKFFYLDEDTNECPQCHTHTLLPCNNIFHKQYMTFEDAYTEMLRGKKIARKGWQGYWYIHPQTSKMVIHLASDKEITEGELGQTVMNTLANDWQVVEDKGN